MSEKERMEKCLDRRKHGCCARCNNRRQHGNRCRQRRYKGYSVKLRGLRLSVQGCREISEHDREYFYRDEKIDWENL